MLRWHTLRTYAALGPMEMARLTLRKPARLTLLIVLIFCSFLTVYILKGSPPISNSTEEKSILQVSRVESETIVTVSTKSSCSTSVSDNEKEITVSPEQYMATAPPDIPIIYVMTPTYKRPTQLPDMTRLSQTLSLVSNLHWVVVEDSIRKSKLIEDLLNRTSIPSTHLLGPTPGSKRLKKYGKGVAPRNAGIKWIRENSKDGVLYFADDDNSYDIRIFDEIRYTKKVAVFPVGGIGVLGLSTPILRNGFVVGFHDPYRAGRKFIIDMAGFSVNVELLRQHPNARMAHKLGHLEDSFLSRLGIEISDLEPKARNCTQILVWHTKTSSGPSPNQRNMKVEEKYNETNLPRLYRSVL